MRHQCGPEVSRSLGQGVSASRDFEGREFRDLGRGPLGIVVGGSASLQPSHYQPSCNSKYFLAHLPLDASQASRSCAPHMANTYSFTSPVAKRMLIKPTEGEQSLFKPLGSANAAALP